MRLQCTLHCAGALKIESVVGRSPVESSASSRSVRASHEILSRARWGRETRAEQSRRGAPGARPESFDSDGSMAGVRPARRRLDRYVHAIELLIARNAAE